MTTVMLQRSHSRQSTAELGATVVAFVSLAGVIRPLYAAVCALREVSSEVTYFRHQLGRLECIVSDPSSRISSSDFPQTSSPFVCEAD